jgi:hypothetical protein
MWYPTSNGFWVSVALSSYSCFSSLSQVTMPHPDRDIYEPLRSAPTFLLPEFLGHLSGHDHAHALGH